MKSKQLFDEVDELSLKEKKNIKNKVKNNVNDTKRNNNNTNAGGSRNNDVLSSVSNRKDKKSPKRIRRSDESAEQKSAVSSKNDKSKQTTATKNSKNDSRKSKDEKSRSGKTNKNVGTKVENSEVVKKKRAELIEDYKKWNAPDECLIGKINERTGIPYQQMSCCKRGWTYLDVTDLKWNKDHFGYNASDKVATKYDNINEFKDNSVVELNKNHKQDLKKTKKSKNKKK